MQYNGAMGSLTRNTARGAILFLAAGLSTGIGIARQDLQVCGTHALRTTEEMALHAASSRTLARSGKVRSAARIAGRDEGNIFVLEDQGDVITRRNLFNLEGKDLIFLPADATAAQYRYDVGTARFDTEASFNGRPLSGLDDDDSRSVELPFAFPYYGKQYTTVFVNSDGNLTFEAKDDASASRSAGRATAGFPRISGLFRDLDPGRVPDSVRVLLEPERAVFTWNAVPDYQDFGTGPRNTFQIRLYAEGRVELSYESIRTRTAVVGIGRGVASPADAIVAFFQGSSERFTNGSIIERFTDVEELDTILAARRFFESHDDSYDYVAFYNDQGVSAGDGALAWESTVRNTTEGIGDPIRDDGVFYGSTGRLQAILNMGPLEQYPDDPFVLVPGRIGSGDNTLSVLAHEVGHRWIAYVSVRDDTPNGNMPMLGRQLAHWSFAFNSEASLLEGNRIADNGAGARPRFVTTATSQAYSPLDQYLMGLVPPSAVEPVFYVANPSIPVQGRAPLPGVSFDGTRRDVTIEELISVHGPRNPDHEIAQRIYRIAIVLVTRAGRINFDRGLAKVERIRANFEPYFDRVTNGRASADTSIRPGIALSAAPAMALTAGERSEVWVSIPAPRDSALDLVVLGGLSEPAITIPAGDTAIAIPVQAGDPGVVTLRVEDPAGAYAPAEARVRVVSARP